MSNNIDIMLLGKTGIGKSTTGNILLGLNSNGSTAGLGFGEDDLIVWTIPDDRGSENPEGKSYGTQKSKLQHSGSQPAALDPTVDGRPNLKGQGRSSTSNTDNTEDSPSGFSLADIDGASRAPKITVMACEPHSGASRSPVSCDADMEQDLAESDLQIGEDLSGTSGTEADNTYSKQTSPASGRLPPARVGGETAQVPKYFPVGEGELSATLVPRLISNKKSMIRVLDTPGFAHTGSSLPVIQANLELIHQIAHLQKAFELHFRYVLYFLPCQGPPQRADRVLKDEIAIMHHYFGESIWRCLVFVMTTPPEFQLPSASLLQPDDPLRTKAEHVVNTALQDVWKSYKVDQSKMVGANIIYLPLADAADDITSKCKAATSKEDVGGLQLRLDVCLKCGAHVQIDCETKVGSSSHIPLSATDKSGSSVSKCHPRFERSLLAQFFQYPSVCIKCQQKRGETMGCVRVGSMHSGVVVTHETMQPMETFKH